MFFEKSYSMMPKQGLKFYFKHNSKVLTMNDQALLFKLSHTVIFQSTRGNESYVQVSSKYGRGGNKKEIN